MSLGNHHYLIKECVAGIYPESGIFHVILFDLAQTFTGNPVKIFENAFSFKCVTDFRVPLKPITKPLSGVLARYAKTVEQANLGAVQK